MAYNVHNQIKGNVSYNKNILLSVIKIATCEIAGVSSLADTFGSQLAKLFSTNYNNGVRIHFNDEKICIHIYINVYYGYNVSEIAYRVQENVKNALTGMTDINIEKINIHVLGVAFNKESLEIEQTA